MENPIKMDDLGVPLFSETSTSSIGNSLQVRIFDMEEGKQDDDHVKMNLNNPQDVLFEKKT